METWREYCTSRVYTSMQNTNSIFTCKSHGYTDRRGGCHIVSPPPTKKKKKSHSIASSDTRVTHRWQMGTKRSRGKGPDQFIDPGNGSEFTQEVYSCVPTRPPCCHSWILVTGPRCHWSGPSCAEVTAAAPCFLWGRWAGCWGSGWPADRSGSPAAAPGSWCSAWPDAGSRSCSASSPEDGWGWACGARRRRCWRCAGASAPSCWWTPSWSWCRVELQPLMEWQEINWQSNEGFSRKKTRYLKMAAAAFSSTIWFLHFIHNDLRE